MAEPLNINLVERTQDRNISTGTNSQLPGQSLIRLQAYQSSPGDIDDDLLLRWTVPNITTTGFTLSVAYISADGQGNFRNRSADNYIFSLGGYPPNPDIIKTSGEYRVYTVNTSNPFTIQLRSNEDNSTVNTGVNIQALQSEDIDVLFTPNYIGGDINYAPTNIAVSATRNTLVTNVRTLTVNAYQDEGGVLYPIAPDFPIAWQFSNITDSTVNVQASSNFSTDTSSIPVGLNFNPIDLPTEYRLVTTPSVCCSFFEIATNDRIPNGVDGAGLTQDLSSIRVVLSANYENINRAPTNITVSAIALDNRYFIRSLTAAVMQNYNGSDFVLADGSSQVKWEFDSSKIWATRPNGQRYTSNTLSAVSAVNVLYFYTSATTYDFTTRGPKICAFDIKATGAATNTNDIYTFSFDEFPNLQVNAFINFENSNFSSYFYRLTSTSPFVGTIRAGSSYYNLNTNLNSNSHNIWYTLNNIPTLSSRFIPEERNFICNTPTVSSVQIYLSSTTPVDLQSNINLKWYTPHIFVATISAIFVTGFPKADFIGWPGSYFKDKTTLDYITTAKNNISASPGMFFYGEGHTDTITLSALTASNVTSYLWSIGNLSATNNRITNLTQTSSMLLLQLSSTRNMDVRIPVSLRVVNTDFPVTTPSHFYNDTTGIQETYPYFASTITLSGTPALNSNKFRESIWIRPYDTPPYTFDPGIKRIEILPSDGTNVRFTGKYFIDPVLFRCYDKYGLIWKWSEICNYNQNDFFGKWQDTESTATYTKKWRNEGGLTPVFDTIPVTCSASPVYWTLSSNTGWPQPYLFQTTASNTFPYHLRVQDFGTNLLTVSYYTSTSITVNVQQTLTCYISVDGGDWLPSDKKISETFIAYVGTNPDVRLYTPNRYVLTGSKVIFENLTTQKQFISSMSIDFEDGNPPLTGVDPYSSFYETTYNTPGKKTVNVTLNTLYSADGQVTTSIQPLTDIVNVVTRYEDVFPNEYRSITSPVVLPWAQQPVVGSNDWATTDNINSCFKKFYENLEYLESRGKAYSDTYSDYFGYLGSVPTSAVNPNACLSWTWEDLDCLNTALNYQVTWKDVLSGDNELDIGSWVKCGQWSNHVVRISDLTPNCLGLYDLEWRWRSRKNSAAVQTTWSNTKLNARYSKKWYYEPSFSSQGIVCSPGAWQVNLPKLDKYYTTIANPTVQAKCISYGITSKNNILYVAQKTQIKLLSSDHIANFFDYRDTVDGVINFSNIKNIHLDKDNKIYILDNLLSQIIALTYEPDTPGDNWKIFTTFGGYGGRSSTNKFNDPNDFYIDQANNIWVCDTGNKCIKHFSNTGTWIKTITDSKLDNSPPLSLATDSDKNVHVLTKDNILVYSYTGEYITSYDYKSYVTGEPRKIIASYSKEILYVATATEVIKFFRNGVFTGYIINNRPDIENITCLYQDEFRNLLIGTDDKILKFADLMIIQKLKGSSPNKYWTLKDIYIDEEEYVQNWVYTKAFQRLWDNIEIFRNSLYYKNTEMCKMYTPPAYTKDKITIGQNELVTSTVVNRVLGYLWENFTSIVKYFDPSCKM
jgi:hypothetical protein